MLSPNRFLLLVHATCLVYCLACSIACRGNVLLAEASLWVSVIFGLGLQAKVERSYLQTSNAHPVPGSKRIVDYPVLLIYSSVKFSI